MKTINKLSNTKKDEDEWKKRQQQQNTHIQAARSRNTRKWWIKVKKKTTWVDAICVTLFKLAYVIFMTWLQVCLLCAWDWKRILINCCLCNFLADFTWNIPVKLGKLFERDTEWHLKNLWNWLQYLQMGAGCNVNLIDSTQALIFSHHVTQMNTWNRTSWLISFKLKQMNGNYHRKH